MEITPHHQGDIGGLVPLEPGRNYADEAKQQILKLTVEDELHKFFLSLFDKEKQDESEWLEIKRQWVKARKYFDGKQYGTVNDKCQWVDYQKRPGEVNYIDNIYHPHIQTALMELSRSQTELTFSHIAKESRHGSLVARIAETRYRTHRKRLFNELKMQQEHLSKLFNGLALRYTYFNWQGRSEKSPVFGQKDVDAQDGTQVCATCSSPVQNGTCPNCGSTEVTEIKTPQFSAKVISGYESVPSGESDWVSVDPLGVIFYIHATTLKDSPYLIWKQAILTDVLRAQYPKVKIEDGIQSRELQLQMEASGRAPNDQFFTDTNTKAKNVTEFVQGWFDASLYANRKIKKDTQLMNGQVLRAGTTLGEAFPKGLYLAKNGNIILDVWNEDKCSKWTAAPYVTRPGTLVGAGTTIALANQDIKNDLRNLHMASIFQDAFRRKFLNSQFIEADQIPDDPNEWAQLQNIPEGGAIVGQVVDVLPPSPLSADAYAMEEKVDASMQMQLGTFSGSTAGAPDLKAVQNTASGFLAWRNMTVGRYAPMLAVCADALDKEQAYQLLENDQKYLTPEQWEKIKGDYGDEALKMFLNCDLREELCIEVVGESYLPQTLEDKRNKTTAFVQLVAQAQLDPQSEMGAFIGDQFDIPKNLIGYDAEVSNANITADSFNRIAEMIVAEFGDVQNFDIQGDPRTMQLAQLVIDGADAPIDPEMDNHANYIDAYKDIWNTDECRTSTNLFKAAITMRVRQHQVAQVKKMQDDQNLAMMAQAPAMQAQQAAQQQQMDAQNAQAQAQADAQDQQSQMEGLRTAADTANRVMELDDKESERQHQAQEADKQRQFQAQQQEEQQAHQVGLQAMQAETKKDQQKAPSKSAKS